jgi:hypothetical protein
MSETISGINNPYLKSFYELGGTKTPHQIGPLLRLEIGERAKQISTISGDLQTQISAETATRHLEVTHINETISTLQSNNGLNEAAVNTLISGAFEILQDQINYLNSQITSSSS